MVASVSSKKCNKICSFLFSPACAYSKRLKTYKDFSNPCLMKNYICEHPVEGYKEYSDKKCPCGDDAKCPQYFAPICAVDADNNYEEFAGDCYLTNYNCRNPKHSML